MLCLKERVRENEADWEKVPKDGPRWTEEMGEWLAGVRMEGVKLSFSLGVCVCACVCVCVCVCV